MTKSQKKRKADCQRKIRHESQGAAWAAARNMNNKGSYVEAYYCQYCKGWHVGRMKHEAKVMEAFKRLELKRKTIPNYV